jgi:hypothetical protein
MDKLKLDLDSEIELNITSYLFEAIKPLENKKTIRSMSENEFKVLAIAANNFMNVIKNELDKKRISDSNVEIKKEVTKFEEFKKTLK